VAFGEIRRISAVSPKIVLRSAAGDNIRSGRFVAAPATCGHFSDFAIE